MRNIDLKTKLFMLSGILLFLSGLTGMAGYFIATETNAFIFLVAAFFIGVVFAYFLVNNLLQSINEISNPPVLVINPDTEKLSASSEELSLAVHQQAAALQETAFSLEELSTSLSNKEVMTKMVELVIEIESKTKIINDIVFQTKLLTLSASIEKARITPLPLS